VLQSALDEFACLGIHHRNLLKARMKITPYNKHLGSFPPSLGRVSTTKFTRLQGADAFIQSTVRIVATPKNWRSFDGAWRPVWFTRKNRWRENARAVCGLRIRVSNGESDWKGGEFHGDFRKEAK
jgi:hypothetical protein